MDRRSKILEGITRNHQGIEIGPWFNPIAPKREGFNCLSLDVYDTETLLSKASEDGSISKEQLSQIEAVDLVGSSVEIESIVREKGLIGQIDYIVSSHNLEHIPDPIKFLQGCSRILKVGGILSLAVPDKRGCFDHFRPHSSLGDWLEAYFEKRQKPTLRQVFEAHQLGALYNGSGAFGLGVNSSQIQPTNNIQHGFDFWVEQVRDGDRQYNDAHCWTLTPAVFELFVLDLAILGLLKFKLESIVSEDFEFHARLRAMGKDWSPGYSKEEYFHIRTNLIHRVQAEQAENCRPVGEESHDTIALKRENQALKMRVRDLEDSTSWRITLPLRRFITLIRSGFASRQKI
ncbi:methyltransferase domain-containing protein [Burkholderia alba]|uniref:methyltransferase domain-containing protein n=1 Tax=Burkholderia alba TaxID=2683677 RepID=UPI002B051C56|nr:methyltransferase domain-containing protein [Burkholderia alba]